MSVNPNEHYRKKIQQTTNLSEGLLSSIVNFLFAKKFQKGLSNLAKQADKDPEFKSALIDYHKQGKRLQHVIDTLCDENPDLKGCKGRKPTRRRHRK